MDCESVREQLGALLDGELVSDEAAAIEQHVCGCPVCSGEVERLRALNDRLAQIAREKVVAPTRLWPAIERRLADAGRRADRPRMAFRRPLAVAASLALLVGVTAFIALVLDKATEPAQATVIDYSVLLDGLAADVEAAVARFLDYYHAEPVEADRVRVVAPKLSFAVPPELPGGFHLVQAYRLMFGPSPGVAARYQRGGEPLVVFFHVIVKGEKTGRYAQLPCIIGGRHGHQVEVGPWRLMHFMDATTCHCVLSTLEPQTELPAIVSAIAADVPAGVPHSH